MLQTLYSTALRRNGSACSLIAHLHASTPTKKRKVRALAAIVSVKHAGETLPDLLSRLDQIEGMEAERAAAQEAMAEANAELIGRIDQRIEHLEHRVAIHQREEAEKQARLAEIREEAAHEHMWRTYGRNWQDNPVARAVWGKLYAKGLVGSAAAQRYWAA